MTVLTSLSITTGMKIMSMWQKRFLPLNSSSVWSGISRKNISKWYVMAVFMPGTEISTKNCFGQFPVKNIMSCAALINGVLPSSMLSAMTPSGAMNAAPPCSFWNCIIGTSVFLLKKCTRKQCPVPVERGLLHSFQNILQWNIISLEETILWKQR